MKTGTELRNFAGITIFVFGLIGLFYLLSKLDERQPKGYYTAQDTLNSYNRGYENGRQDLRHTLTQENTDTTIKSCQE